MDYGTLRPLVNSPRWGDLAHSRAVSPVKTPLISANILSVEQRGLITTSKLYCLKWIQFSE